MESDLETRVNFPAVRVNRAGMYAVVAVLGIVILSCVGVLGYSFSNYALLKRNAEEMRQYVVSQTNASGQNGGGKRAAVGDHQPRFMKSPNPAAAMGGIVAVRELGATGQKIQSANNNVAVIAKQEAPVVTPKTRRRGFFRRARGGKLPTVGAAATFKIPSEAYDILVASVGWNDTDSK